MSSGRSVRTAAVLVAVAVVLAWIAWSQFGAERVRDVEDLQVGDCVTVPSGDFTDVVAVPVVSCDRSHNAELYLIERLDRPRDRAYPGEERARAEAMEVCAGDPFDAYVPDDRTDVETVVVWPSEIDWWPTRGVVYCFVRLDGEATTTERIGRAPER